MNIETKRLILRDLVEQDAEALLKIKNDEQVMKHPFFKGDETIDFIRIMIAFFQSVLMQLANILYKSKMKLTHVVIIFESLTRTVKQRADSTVIQNNVLVLGLQHEVNKS